MINMKKNCGLILKSTAVINVVQPEALSSVMRQSQRRRLKLTSTIRLLNADLEYKL